MLSPATPASLAETSRSEMAELDPGYGDGAISPSLVLTEGDYGEQSEIQTQRSTLLRCVCVCVKIPRINKLDLLYPGLANHKFMGVLTSEDEHWTNISCSIFMVFSLDLNMLQHNHHV